MLDYSKPVVYICLVLTCTGAAFGQDVWVGTWGTAPLAYPNSGGEYAVSNSADAGAGTTLRQIVHVSLGGSQIRVILTNEFGEEPLTVNAAQVALPAANGNIVSGSSKQLTFSGRPSIVIPPGALIMSDALSMKVAPLSDLAISMFIPNQTISVISRHGFSFQTSFMVSGNQVGAETLAEAKPITTWDFLKGVDVKGNAKSATVVALGDSITDGALSTHNTNSRWPDVLARRFAANKRTELLGVLNMGIGGNRILRERLGPSALARFDRDVLSQDGVKYLIILEGINDIGSGSHPKNPEDKLTAEDLIGGFMQMIERAHAHGIKVIGATLTPYSKPGTSSPPPGEPIRLSLNDWIRTTKLLDGYVDFDKAVRDPTNPRMIAPVNDGGDHLHMSDTGFKAMGAAFDLKLFTK